MKFRSTSRVFMIAAIGVGSALTIPASSAQGPVHLGNWQSVESAHVSRECTGPNGAAIAGDLDGDGQRDKAALLENRSKDRLGVFVHVGPQTNVWQPVTVFPGGTAARDVCIELAPPGSYPTACGLSRDRTRNVNCRLGEPEKIDLRTNGIRVHLRRQETLFYWDKNTKHFSELLMKEVNSRGTP